MDQVEPIIAAKLEELKIVIDLRRKGDPDGAVKEVRTGRGKRFMDQARVILGEMERDERELLKRHAAAVEVAAANGKTTIVIGTIVCLLFLVSTAFLLTRSFNNQIGAAVRHMQSSSAELQSAANQQASGRASPRPR